MTRFVPLLALLLLAMPAMAQNRPAAEAARATIVLPAAPEIPHISAGHAAALGAGLFAGAVAGSVLINGGAFAAAVGAAAGLLVGNWYWTEHRDSED